MTPSQARIDAALRLARAVDIMDREYPGESTPRVSEALSAYRATLPRLRTRAEVDADLVHQLRRYAKLTIEHRDRSNLWPDIERLCAEPTAPEGPEVEANGDPDPCSCEQSEALKDQLTECQRLLSHAYRTASELTKALETTPG